MDTSRSLLLAAACLCAWALRPTFLAAPLRSSAVRQGMLRTTPARVRPGLSAASLGAAAATLAAAQAAFGKRRSRPVARNAGPILFGSQGSRSPLVNWYLHEIGQEFQMVQAAQVDRTSPDYPHPFGKIPALLDGDVKVFESGAILMYLADKYGGLDTPAKRAEAGKWVVWANASLDPICFKEDGNGRVLGTGLADDPPPLRTLDALLADREFLLGNGEESFSVADVAVGSYLLYVPLFFPDINTLPRWPNVQRYMLQLLQRPAYAKAFGEGTAQQLQNVVSRKADSKLFGLF